jgi:hypothetical protein
MHRTRVDPVTPLREEWLRISWLGWIRVNQSFQFFDKLVGILKIAVDRSKSDIGDPVEFLEGFHHFFSDFPTIDFRVTFVEKRAFNIERHLFQLASGYRPLLTGQGQTTEKLLPVKRFSPAILFLDRRDGFLNPFVSGESPPATFAIPPPPDTKPVSRQAGIADLGVRRVAIRTFQWTFPSDKGVRINPYRSGAFSGDERQLPGLLSWEHPSPDFPIRDE